MKGMLLEAHMGLKDKQSVCGAQSGKTGRRWVMTSPEPTGGKPGRKCPYGGAEISLEATNHGRGSGEERQTLAFIWVKYSRDTCTSLFIGATFTAAKFGTKLGASENGRMGKAFIAPKKDKDMTL